MTERGKPHTSYVLTVDHTIGDALSAITENKRGAVVLTDEEGTLRGVVSDGDIRRALVKGATMLTPIDKAANLNVMTVSAGVRDIRAQGSAIFDEHPGINMVPVIDEKNAVVDVLVRNQEG